jgi:hypothetical protein
VRLFDCPLIPPSVPGLPPSIVSLPSFLGDAWSAWTSMLSDIQHFKDNGEYPGPWILMNAWSIYDRRTEAVPGDYTDNPNHFFTIRVNQAVNDHQIDVVFCAGNCGLFCADMRCGTNDRGPGLSIHGANAFARVLTVGAVRTDTVWLGYSSQGPGPPHLAYYKPDLSAPSQFSEDHNAFDGNVGTSAAAAVAAGVVAALRQRWAPPLVSPDQLRQILVDTARRTEPAWNGRVGNGIIDGSAAYDSAEQQFPVEA